MTTRLSIAAALVLCGTAAIALRAAASGEPEGAPPARTAAAAATAAAAPAAQPDAAPSTPAPGAATEKEAAAPRQATTALATFPDGTAVPVLNGARDPVAMPWPPGRPFSPIVATVVDHGQEWYQHADGCLSTTVTRFDDAAGIYRTAAQVAEPVPVQPTVLRGR